MPAADKKHSAMPDAFLCTGVHKEFGCFAACAPRLGSGIAPASFHAQGRIRNLAALLADDNQFLRF